LRLDLGAEPGDQLLARDREVLLHRRPGCDPRCRWERPLRSRCVVRLGRRFAVDAAARPGKPGDARFEAFLAAAIFEQRYHFTSPKILRLGASAEPAILA